MNAKNKIIAIIGAFAATVLLMAFLSYSLWLGIKKSYAEITEDKAKVALAVKQRNALEDFIKKYPDSFQEMAFVDNIWVDKKNPVGFIEFIENAAKETDINAKIDLLAQVEIAEENGLSFISFQVAAEGTFSSLIEFIGKLEAGNYLVEIQSAAISENPQSKEEKQETIKASFVLRVAVK